VADVLGLVGQAIDAAKKLTALSEKLRDADAKNAIADLSLALADLKIETAELKSENFELKSQLATSAAQGERVAHVEFRDGYYFLAEPQQGRPDGPFCTRCFEVDKQLVVLKELTGRFAVFGKYSCPECKSKFGR